MGLQEISTQDEPLSSERDSEAAAEDSGGLIAGLRDYGNINRTNLVSIIPWAFIACLIVSALFAQWATHISVG